MEARCPVADRIILHRRDEPIVGVHVKITDRVTTIRAREKGKRKTKSFTLHNISIEEAYDLFVNAVAAANAKRDKAPDAEGGSDA